MELIKTFFIQILPQYSAIIVCVLTILNARLIAKERKEKTERKRYVNENRGFNK